jgi:hypothetical protein
MQNEDKIISSNSEHRQALQGMSVIWATWEVEIRIEGSPGKTFAKNNLNKQV